MIALIEGPRHSGKTHLLNEYFRRNQNPDIVYYKFQFAKYIDQLGITDQETGPGVHYFSIANILTILELNQTFFKNKVMVFDRCVFSAYVWSIYRQRMDRDRLFNEFEKMLNMEVYQSCAVMYLTRENFTEQDKREKDYFGNFEDYFTEKSLFDEVFERVMPLVDVPSRSNRFSTFTNRFDEQSVDLFCKELDRIIGNSHESYKETAL